MKFKRTIAAAMSAVMIAGTLVFSIPSAAAEKTFPFTDVSQNKYYTPAVEYVYKNELMNGTTSTTFEPTTKMSRAMFVTVLGRLCNVKSDKPDNFTDTNKNTWYSKYVGWADNAGIMQGYAGKFRPNDPITRQEAAVCVSRLISYLDVMLDYTDVSPDDYKDDDKIAASWALEHVEMLSRYGIIQGDQNGNFNPTLTLDRAQGATILMRLHKKYLAATDTSSALNVWDFFNTPEQLITNMDSEKNTSTTLPSMDLTVCSSDSAPWFFGVNITYSDIPAGGLEYIKFAYKTSDGSEEPYLELSSPIYTEKLTPTAVSTEGEYTVLIFKTGEAMRKIRTGIFTEKEDYFNTANDVFDFDYASYNSRYLRAVLYPFGDNNDVSANVSYIGFFSKEEDAKAYTANSESSRYKDGEDIYAEADIRDATEDVIEKYTDQMNSRIDEIINTENTYSPSDIEGTCYYISSIHGKAGNDGLSPETPFASPRELYNIFQPGFSVSILKEGDAVFFERGSVFYKAFETNSSGDFALATDQGVIYTTYGNGPKPIFTGCLDINGSMDWEATEYKNVWKMSEKLTLINNDNPGARCDVGNIIFTDKDGNTGWGIMVYADNAENTFAEGTMSVDNALVTNGYEVFDSGVRELADPGALQNNLEFFHDWNSNSLYLYCDSGNPGEVFEKIIVSTRGHVINGNANTVFDNLSIMYTGSHGINAGALNCTIQNCTIEWIGGSHQSDGTDSTRYGNGVEIYGSSEGYTITNCYVNQVYDGGISTQISTSDNVIAVQNNLEFSNNVITNTNSHIEIWNYGVGSTLANVKLTGNYLAYGGYHFGAQRPNKGGSLLYLGRFSGQNYENSLFENNVFMFAHALICGRPLLARGETNGTVMKNNVYISSTKTRLGELQADWRNDFIGGDAINHAQMYTVENIQKMVSDGIEEGTVFYMTDEYFDKREADGLFYNRGGNWRH